MINLPSLQKVDVCIGIDVPPVAQIASSLISTSPKPLIYQAGDHKEVLGLFECAFARHYLYESYDSMQITACRYCRRVVPSIRNAFSS